MSKSNTKSSIEPINKNKAVLEAKIKSMIGNGRKEITTIKEMKKYPIGSLISYMDNNNIYKSGGFLWRVKDEYFIYLNLDTDQKTRVRIKNVSKMWIGSVYEVSNDVISIVATNNNKTPRPVMVNDVVIYYGKNKGDFYRFICTAKYKLIEKWCKIFG